MSFVESTFFNLFQQMHLFRSKGLYFGVPNEDKGDDVLFVRPLPIVNSPASNLRCMNTVGIGLGHSQYTRK